MASGATRRMQKLFPEIRSIKSRAQNPFSVIAPSVEWIKENCVVEKEAEAWLKKTSWTIHSNL